jgi:short-subunit dehydrogenase
MSIVIIGAGPNLGMAVARRFGREGLAVGLVSRTQAKLDGLAAALEGEGITAAGAAADIRDPDALAAAIASLAGRLGDVEVLEYSPPARIPRSRSSGATPTSSSSTRPTRPATDRR